MKTKIQHEFCSSYPERNPSVDMIFLWRAASSKCPTALRARDLASKTFVNNSRTTIPCWSIFPIQKLDKSSIAS